MLANVPPVVRLQKHLVVLSQNVRLQKYLREPPGPSVIRENLRAPWLAVSVVSMARGLGTMFGISLMALAWHLGSHSYQAGNPGYSGSEQARTAFAVLAVVAATAAAIALASRTRPREPAERPREGSPSGADH